MGNTLDRFKEEIVEEKVIDVSKKVRVGIIGTGWIAEEHIKNYLKRPDVEVVAASDIVPGKAKKFCEQFGAPDATCYEDTHEMLEKEQLDIVSICTYNCQHAPCAIDALNHGVNVMLEKPFTVTLEEAVEVMKAEKKSGKLLTIGFQPRMSEYVKLLKEVVDSGELGDIYYLQAGGGRRYGIPTPYGTTFIEKETGGVGAMGDIGSYSLDLLLNAVGYPKPLTVTGYTSNFLGKQKEFYSKKHPEYAEKFGVEDFAAGFIRLEGGIILDFRISWAMHMDTLGDALILGTKGGLKIPSTECWNGYFSKPMTVYKMVAGKQISYELPVPKSDDFFEKKITSFVDAVKDGGKPTVPSSQALINQAIIDGIVKSNELGHEIEIEIPEI